MKPTDAKILLDLSSAIATVRNRDDLFHLILEKINPVFNCSHEAVVLSVDEDQKFYRILLSELSKMPAAEREIYRVKKFRIDPVIQSILGTDGPLIFQTEPLIEKYPEEPGPELVKSLGVKEVMSCRLQVSGRIIGKFSLHSKRIDHFRKADFGLFQAVADIVAVAVSNILANEEVTLREHHKSQLLKISKHIASVRDRNDLFHLIAEELKSFIRFDNAVISVLNEESKSFGILLAHAEEAMAEEAQYRQAIAQTFPLEEGSVPYLVLHSEVPLIINIEKEHFDHPEFDYITQAYKLGMREEIVTRLMHSGKTIGALVLISRQHGTYSEADIKVLQSLSSLFAIALNNILANQEIELREHHKTQLQKISTHIATVRDRNDLFRLIAGDMKAFIDFDDVEIAIIDKEKQQFKFFLSHANAADGSGVQTMSAQSYPIQKQNPFFGPLTNQTNEPFINDIETLYLANPEIESIRYVYNLGMREEIVAPLLYSEKVIGVMSVLSKTKTRFEKADIATVRSLSTLLAIALNNILSNQELELREQQKSHLLKISSHISSIKEKNDLFRLITEEVKTFIPFDDLVIAQVDEEKQTFGVFLSNMGEASSQHENYEPSITQVHALIKDTIPHKAFISGRPFIIDVKEEFEKDKSDYLRYAYEFGTKQELVGRLVHSGKVVGLLAILSKTYRYTNTDIDTLQELSSLMAIAVNNIIANDELRKREHQKSQLLKISSHIATIREKEDLFRLIAVEMKSFIDFDDVVIALINEEKQTYSVFLSDVAGITSKHADFKKANSQVYHIRQGGIIDKIYRLDKPVLIDIEREHLKDPEIESLRFAYQFGMREEIIVRLVYSGKTIGMMGILSKRRNRFSRTDVETASSLSSLVAIALNNILANQELKLREQQKSQLLNISTHISTIRDKNDLFRLLTKEVRSFIDFDDAIISVLDEKLETFSVFVSDMAEQSNQHKDFSQAITKVFPIIKGSIAHQVIQSEKPVIIDVKKEMFKHPELEFLKLGYSLGFREEILTRLMHSGKVIGVFVLFSRTPGRFSESDAATLQSLSSLIAVALNNILANEEIENLSRQLEQDNVYLNEEIKSNYNFEEIIGESPPLQEVFRKAVQVAHVDSTVLILGETGTGKELIARAIHNLSSRKGRPLIKVNCAALPAQLIESELFGHEKGSFTGATDKRTGKFELANGSTIFLDEIGELPLELQAKLLRVLQEKEIERIGSERSIKVDVRIVAATNRILEKEVSAGKFRSDLYYRLNIYPIELPALRERKEDIPLLASFFLQKLSNKIGKKITSIAPNVMDELLANRWPGNIRELEHTIERSMLLTQGKTIANLFTSKPILVESAIATGLFQPKSLAQNEKNLILQTLKYTRGKIRGKGGAAELLEILPTTLEARMKKLGIKKEFVNE